MNSILSVLNYVLVHSASVFCYFVYELSREIKKIKYIETGKAKLFINITQN